VPVPVNVFLGEGGKLELVGLELGVQDPANRDGVLKVRVVKRHHVGVVNENQQDAASIAQALVTSRI